MRRTILLILLPVITYAKAEDRLFQADQRYYETDFPSWYERVAHPSHKIPTPMPKPLLIRTWPKPVTKPTPPPTRPTPPPYKPPPPTPKPAPTPTKSPYHPSKDNDLPDNAEYLTGYTCKNYDGYFVYANECESYVECRHNIAIKYVCPDGLYFNPSTPWPDYPCSYPTEVQCEGRMLKQIAQPTSECPRQYGYFPTSGNDCSTYIMCHKGLATVKHCPPGLVFNPPIASCDWPVNVPECKPQIFQGFTCPTSTLDEFGQPSDADEIIKFRYGRSCKDYIACQQGHPRLLSCDAGLAFDEGSESCIEADYVKNCEA